MGIVCGEVEATNYFFSLGDQENVLELPRKHDGRSRRAAPGAIRMAAAPPATNPR